MKPANSDMENGITKIENVKLENGKDTFERYQNHTWPYGVDYLTKKKVFMQFFLFQNDPLKKTVPLRITCSLTVTCTRPVIYFIGLIVNINIFLRLENLSYCVSYY